MSWNPNISQLSWSMSKIEKHIKYVGGIRLQWAWTKSVKGFACWQTPTPNYSCCTPKYSLVYPNITKIQTAAVGFSVIFLVGWLVQKKIRIYIYRMTSQDSPLFSCEACLCLAYHQTHEIQLPPALVPWSWSGPLLCSWFFRLRWFCTNIASCHGCPEPNNPFPLVWKTT